MPLVQMRPGPNITEAVSRGAQERRAEKEFKQLTKFRGLQMEAIQADIKTAEIARRKEERIRGLRQEALGGGPVSALGVESLGQAQDVQKIRAEQQKQLTEAITRRWPIIKAMPEGVDKQAEMQSLIAAATRGGLLDENGPGSGAGAADQLSFMAQNDPQAFESVVDQVLGGDQKRLPAAGIVTFENPAGEVKRIDMTTPEGRQQALALGSEWVKRPSRQMVQTGPFDIQKQEVRDLRTAEIATKQAIATGNEIIDKMDADPDAFAKTASFANVVSGLGTEVEAMARVMGVNIPIDVRDASQYAGKFEELGIKGTVAQGLALDLALSYAAASGLGTGRALTNKDIERAFDRIGIGGLRTPAARRAAVESVMGVLDRNFRIRYETLAGKPYEGNLGMKQRRGAPYGKTIIQGGVTYRWNGYEYAAEGQ